MALKVKCKCGKIYEIKPEWLGKRLRCKKCDHVIVLPKTVPQKKTAGGTASSSPTAKKKPAKKPATVASGGLDDLLSGDLAALEQSAAAVETTRKPPETPAPATTAYVPGGSGTGYTSMDRASATRAAALTGMRAPASTNYLLALIAGVVAGACGAGVWAAIAFYADMQLGIIAWGIGGLVGLAMVAAGREGSFLLGLCSVAIVFVSIMAGKALAVHMIISDLTEGGALAFTEDDYIRSLADDIASEREEAGQKINWPDIDFSDDASVKDSYPPDIWQEAVQQWNDLGADGQQTVRDSMDAQVEQIGGAVHGAMVGIGVLFSFGLFDIVFFGLAMVSSFKIATGGIGN